MSKSILKIDTPKNCYECRCSNEGCYLCQISRRQLEDDFQERRPSWCPLRPLPEKKNEVDIYGFDLVKNRYATGWNACLDEIMGETE